MIVYKYQCLKDKKADICIYLVT